MAKNVTKPVQDIYHLTGGIAIAAFTDLVFEISEQGADERKLGRWGYITIIGKNEIKNSSFTCYCPYHVKSPESSYSQQLTYTLEHENQRPDTSCPRQLFGIDFKTIIGKRIENGHQILLMEYFNSEYTGLTLWTLELGLIDIIAKNME